jgi:DnaJ-class molecular chaperone
VKGVNVMRKCGKCKGLGKVPVKIEGIEFLGEKTRVIFATCDKCFGKGSK